MKRLFNYFLIAALIVAASSCSKRIIPELPQLNRDQFNLDSLPVSEINLPVVVNLAPLYKFAEQIIDTVFTSPNWPDDWIVADCATRYKYHFRRGPLELSAAGNILRIGFTGYYRIIGSTRACAGNTVLSPWTPPCSCGFEEGPRRVKMQFLAAISLMPDYTAKIDISRQAPQAIDKCTVCFWKQDITSQVMKGLEEELDLAIEETRKQFSGTDLRPWFTQIWNQLNTPSGLGGFGWLQVNPQQLRINNLYAKGDSLHIYVGLTARPKVSLQKPPAILTPLPRLFEMSHNTGFNIFLDAQLDYDSLGRILTANLKDRRIDIDKAGVRKHIIVKGIAISGQHNEKLIVRVDFEGSERGSFYLTGKPLYDADTRIISLENLDFDIRTRNMLLRTAEWMFNRRVVNELEQQLRFDMKQYADTAIRVANEYLNNELAPGVKGSGAINDISLIGIYPLRNYLQVRLNLSGNLSVNIDQPALSF